MKKSPFKFNWLSFLLLFILFMITMRIMRYSATQVALASNGIEILDLNFGNTPQMMQQTLDAMGVQGRSTYLHLFFLVDFFYPITYAFFYSYSILFFRYKAQLLKHKTYLLAILPVMGMVCDWLENLFITLLITHYPKKISLLYVATNIVTILKFIFVYLSLIIMLFFIIIMVFKNIKAISHNNSCQ